MYKVHRKLNSLYVVGNCMTVQKSNFTNSSLYVAQLQKFLKKNSLKIKTILKFLLGNSMVTDVQFSNYVGLYCTMQNT